MGAKRVVAPDGRVWTVGRVWVGERLRVRRDRESDLSSQPGDDAGGSAWSDLMAIDDLTPAGILAGIALTVALILALAVVWPVIAIAIELVLLLVIAVGGVAGRVLFRRPWTVRARAGDDQLEWKVSGWRASGALVGEIGRRIVAGEDPARLALGNQDQLHVG